MSVFAGNQIVLPRQQDSPEQGSRRFHQNNLAAHGMNPAMDAERLQDSLAPRAGRDEELVGTDLVLRVQLDGFDLAAARMQPFDAGTRPQCYAALLTSVNQRSHMPRITD